MFCSSPPFRNGRHRPRFFRSAGLCLALLAASFPPLAFAENKEPGMDFVIVVDTSGSMNADLAGHSPRTQKNLYQPPSRIEHLIDSLKGYVSQLAQVADQVQVRLRLISFNSGIKTNREFRLDDPAQLKQLNQTIEELKSQPNPKADTHLWEALRFALNESAAYVQEDPDITVCLYVLTDGEQDNQDPGREMDISFQKVLDGSPHLSGDALYGSLVLLGRGDGFFTPEFVEGLKNEAGERFDVELSEDFAPILPPIIATPRRIDVDEKSMIVDRSPGSFVRYEWEINGQSVDSSQRAFEHAFPADGRYEIKVKAFDAKGRRARARKVVNVRSAAIKAVPVVRIDGKPFADAAPITVGQTLTLSHESTGPVDKVAWSVNGQENDAATFSKPLEKVGPVEITLTVESAPNAAGDTTSDTSSRITFQVVPPQLAARPEVRVDGKPLAEIGAIHPGATLTLVSMNTANAQSFDWQIGEEELSGQTVTWQVPAAGTYDILHTVSGSGVSDTAAPISLTVVNPELAAVAEVMYEGRPLADADNVYTGRTLLLVSKSTGPVKRAVWTINGKEVEGETVSYEITDAGDLEIQLTVQGDTDDQTSSSGITRVLAKNPAPVWMLWAVGLSELALLGLLAYFFSGNRLRDSRVQVEGGRALPVKKHWSRLHKEARIFVGKILPGEYWRKRDRKEAILVTPVPVASGPPGALSCTFKSAMAGVGAVSMDEDPTRRTPTEIHYNLIDERDEDQKQSVGISLQILKPTHTDTWLLLLSAAALASFFILFLIKIYPTLH